MKKTSAAKIAVIGCAATLLGVLALAAPASAQGADKKAAEEAVSRIDELDKAVVDAWTKAPLTVRLAVFQSAKAEAFGTWQERGSSTFAPGEKLVTYAEPVGYVWKDIGGGLRSIEMTLDFTVKTPTGKVLGGQEAFQHVNFKSRRFNREFFLNLTMDLTGITPGDYVLVYTMHDLNGGKTGSFEQPFTIAGKPG